MTVDDDCSIYVGGLPYDATDDTLRRVFDIYGAVVAVKIINDRSVGGKCYGFVTFTNPRSAMHAINEMDGRTIEGRVVRVNEVRTKAGRANFARDISRRNPERDDDRGRVRERDDDYHGDRYRDVHRSQSRDHHQDRERAYDRARDHDRSRDHFVDKTRFQDHNLDMEYVEHGRKRDRSHDRERDSNQDMAIQRNLYHHKNGDKDKDEMPKPLNGLGNHSEREFSSKLSGGHDQVEKQLEILNQKLEDLQNEISLIEELAEDKKNIVSKLQEKSQRLEDAVTAARKLTSHRQMQLAKLHKCYAQVRDYNERLKNSEQELQSLVDSTTLEVEYGDGVLANEMHEAAIFRV